MSVGGYFRRTLPGDRNCLLCSSAALRVRLNSPFMRGAVWLKKNKTKQGKVHRRILWFNTRCGIRVVYLQSSFLFLFLCGGFPGGSFSTNPCDEVSFKTSLNVTICGCLPMCLSHEYKLCPLLPDTGFSFSWLRILLLAQTGQQARFGYRGGNREVSDDPIRFWFRGLWIN